jgi:hypothetical protein
MTLLFHTYYSCASSVIGSCTHNHTTYLVCSHVNRHIYFNPTYCPREQWLEIRAPRSIALINQCQCLLFEPIHQQPMSMFFDACTAKGQGECGGIGCGSGGLTWERAYMSNYKYMCWGDNACSLMMWVLIIVFIGLCFMGHMAKGKIHSPPSQGNSCPWLHP